MGALAQAAEHFGIQWVGPAVWKTPEHGAIELSEGTPAMLKHLVLEQRETKNKLKYGDLTQKQESMQAVGQGKDLTLAQAIAADIDWDFLSSGMAAKKNTHNCTRRVITAAPWGTVPTQLWLATHG